MGPMSAGLRRPGVECQGRRERGSQGPWARLAGREEGSGLAPRRPHSSQYKQGQGRQWG